MVSPFWSACSEGNLDRVLELFNDPSQVDLELKDQTGSTPLIEAIKIDHVEIVKLLLDKGANPNNASSQGLPSQLTANPAILELLIVAQAPQPSQENGAPPVENGFTPLNPDAKPVFYPPPPPGAYPYFHPGQPIPEGAGFYAPYPPPPPHPHANGDAQPSPGPGNLPPPEIARFIPCRYYPACRYGASCMFAHPPPGGYIPGPPPGPYPYDPNMPPQSYPPSFYPPPHAFPPQNGIPPNSSPSPNGPPAVNGHIGPEGPPQPPFSPNGATASYNGAPPMSPSYSVPPAGVPVPMPGSIPPQPIVNGAQSPAAYNGTVPQGAFVPRPDMPYPPPNGIPYPGADGQQPQVNGDADGYAPLPVFRENGHVRRGSGRRGSFGGRKPPCLFFPVGKCKNGNECRFPHVLSDNIPARGPGSRPPRPHMNGVDGVAAKFGHMNINGNGRPVNGNHFGRGGKFQNGGKTEKKPFLAKQKLPSADDFPVLTGATTPPARSPVPNGQLHLNGPTAAQVLQAPAPRKDTGSSTAPSSTRGPSPDPAGSPPQENGHLPVEQPTEVKVETPPAPAPKKLPVSFAAAAAAPEVSKEQAVSA